MKVLVVRSPSFQKKKVQRGGASYRRQSLFQKGEEKNKTEEGKINRRKEKKKREGNVEPKYSAAP